MSYLQPCSLSVLLLPNNAVTSANIYISPWVKDDNFHICYWFYIGILEFSVKRYYHNFYHWQKQQDTNKNAFGLPYGVLVQFRWTPKVCVNHNANFWWTNHWCVNHILICFLVNKQVCKPGYFQPKNYHKVEQTGIKIVNAYQFILHFVPVSIFP